MKELSYTWYCILGTLIYFGLSSLIVKFSLKFDDFNTNSQLFENFYFRGMVFTEYLPVGQFVYYWIMLPVGFTFVNLVTLKNERKNPFLDNHMSYRSFILIITVIAPVFFFVSAIVALRGQNDLDGYCHSQYRPESEEREILDTFPQDETPSCKKYDFGEVFKYNYFVWTLGYFIGL